MCVGEVPYNLTSKTRLEIRPVNSTLGQRGVISGLSLAIRLDCQLERLGPLAVVQCSPSPSPWSCRQLWEACLFPCYEFLLPGGVQLRAAAHTGRRISAFYLALAQRQVASLLSASPL